MTKLTTQQEDYMLEEARERQHEYIDEWKNSLKESIAHLEYECGYIQLNAEQKQQVSESVDIEAEDYFGN